MSATTACFHCGEDVPPAQPVVAIIADKSVTVCCHGCKAVAEFIDSNDLSAFYRHRQQPRAGMELTPEAASYAAYDADALRNRYVFVDDKRAEAIVDIGGMYCSACAWLLHTALTQHPAISAVDINASTRRAVITWQLDELPFSRLLDMIAGIGFKPHPVGQDQQNVAQDVEYRQALKRLIVAAAAGMQVMMFAVALYAGDYFGIQPGIEKFLRLISLIVATPIVFYSAVPFFRGAWRGLRSGKPSMDLPVALAIATAFYASVRAIWLDSGDIYLDSVAMFVGFLSATRFIEMRARHRSDSHAQALSQLLPDTCVRVNADGLETISLDSLRGNDTVLILPGDVLPADGVLVDGALQVDESILTGEAMPQARAAGATVYAGSINRTGSARVRISQTGASTSLAGIGRLLERARADRPAIAVLADRVASYFVVALLIIAAVTAIMWSVIDPPRAFAIVLATLVVTCPCALALATPAALAASAGRLASQGVLLVRSRLLQVLRAGTTVVFDKTGTLTVGQPTIIRTHLFNPAFDERHCLAVASALESASEHVLARAFASVDTIAPAASQLQPEPGRGVAGVVDGTHFRIGSYRYVAEIAGQLSDVETSGAATHVYLGSEAGFLAAYHIGDALRADARATIDALRLAGFRIAIASGDHATAVADVATELAVDDWHANLTPAGKLNFVKERRQSGERIVMVGDGINDAPVLATADASIAIDAGTALARASADAIALSKRLGSIVDAAETADRTRRVIRQNLVWALGYNLSAVPLAATGFLAPWMAALGMSLSSLVVVLNALRLRNSERRDTQASPLCSELAQRSVA